VAGPRRQDGLRGGAWQRASESEREGERERESEREREREEDVRNRCSEVRKKVVGGNMYLQEF
jgi:hypothetical protein